MTKTLRPGSESPGAATEGDRRRQFRPDIEGLRAVAVVVVVAFHVGVPGFDGGYVGVDVFLVISGFLITGHLLRSSEVRGGRRLLDFYGHRVQRILPAATVAIVGTLVGALLLQPALFQQQTALDARSASLFFSNLRFEASTGYFQRALPPSPFLQFWSLSLEEQFYLLWPVIVLIIAAALAGRSGRRQSRVLAIAGVLTVVSFTISWWAVGSNSSFAYFTLASRAWEFLAGGLLAALAVWTSRIESGWIRVAPWIGLALIAIATVKYDPSTSFPGPAALLPVGGAALVILGWHHARGQGNPVLSTRPFQLVGRYSYSLYLWHWPVLVLLAARFPTIATNWKRGAAVMLVIGVPLALASYHLVENPVRRSGRIRADWRLGVGMGVALVAFSVGASYVYSTLAHHGPYDAGRPAAAQPFDGTNVVATDFVPSNLDPELSTFARAAGPSSIGCPGLGTCRVGNPSAETSVALFGDSHAAEWTPALAQIAVDNGWRMDRYAAGACGSFLFPALRNPTVNCGEWRREVLDQLAADPPDVIVLSNLSALTYAANPQEWRQGVIDGLAALPAESKVVVFSETPRAEKNVPICLASHLEDTRPCEPAMTPELRQLNAELGRLVEDAGGTFVDLESWMCTADRCPAITGNVLVYSDDSHVTEPFVLSRTGQVADVLTAVAAADTRN